MDRHRRGRTVVLAGAGFALIASAFIVTIGLPFWALACTVWMIGTLVLAQRLSWTLSLLGSLVIILTAETVALRLLPATGLPLVYSQLILGVLVGGVMIGVLALSPGRIKLPRRSQSIVALTAAVAPAMASIVILVTVVTSGFSRISWAMRNDAVWTVMSARHIIADGGIDVSSHPNSSPLASGLMAVAAAPGLSGLDRGSTLRLEVVRSAEFWIVLFLLTSLVIGICIARTVGPGRPVLRLVTSFIGACLPFSWYISGLAAGFGFYSASVVTLLLVVSWAMWKASSGFPLISFVLFILTATSVLAAWAPLVVVPLAFAAMIFIANIRRLWVESRLRVLVAWGTSVGVFLIYIAAVIVPDFDRDGGALAGGGAAPPVSFASFIATVLVFLASGLILHRPGDRFRDLLEGVVLVVALLAGLGVLVWQTRHQPDVWIYYPIKIAWLSISLLLVSILTNVASISRRLRVGTVAPFATVGIGGVVLLALMFQTAPAANNPSNLVPGWGVARQAGTYDSAAAVLFSSLDRNEKIILSKYSASPNDDYFVNSWALQATAQRAQEKVRSFSYYLDPSNGAQVCEAAKSWGTNVTVLTMSEKWGSTLTSLCANPELKVVVGPER